MVNEGTEVGPVAMKLLTKRKDDRVERILQDPKTYFAEARRVRRQEVIAEMETGPQHLQAYGIVHGGVHSGIIETTFLRRCF